MANDLLVITASYFVVILMGFGLLQFLTGGFLFTYLRIRASRGAKTLVMIRGTTRDYFKSGSISGGFLVYKFEKSKKRLKCDRRSIFMVMGVNAVQVDEITNEVVNIDFKAVNGFDAVKVENLYIRALTAPTLADTKTKILLGAVLVTALLTLLVAYLTYNIGVKMDAVVIALAEHMAEQTSNVI